MLPSGMPLGLPSGLPSGLSNKLPGAILPLPPPLVSLPGLPMVDFSVKKEGDMMPDFAK